MTRGLRSALLLYVCICISVMGICQQKMTTITAAKIGDASGVPLAKGLQIWTPTYCAGTPQQFHVGGGGWATSESVKCNVVNGAITTNVKGGTCQVADSKETQPANLCYDVQIKDTVNTKNAFPIVKNVQPTGSAWSWDDYVPTNVPNALQTSGPKGDKGDSGVGTDPNCHTDGNGKLICGSVAATTMQPAGNAIYSQTSSGAAPTLRVYSTSEGAGYHVSGTDEAHSYPHLAANALGWSIINRSVPSSNIADVVSAETYADAPHPHPLYDFSHTTTNDDRSYFAPGDNNAHTNAMADSDLALYAGAMRTAILFAGLPEFNPVTNEAQLIRPATVLGSICTTTGTWTTDTTHIPGAPSVWADTPGASLSCTVDPGRAIDIVVGKIYSTPASNVPFTVKIDDIPAFDDVSQTTTFNVALPPQDAGRYTNELTYTIHVPEQGQGKHNVVITLASGGSGAGAGAYGPGSNLLRVYAIASVSPASTNANGPQVWWGSPIRWTAAGNAATGASDGAKELYRLTEAKVIQQMATAGLQVKHIHLLSNSAFRPEVDADADGVHANTTTGTPKLAAAVIAEMTAAATNRRSEAWVHSDVSNLFTQPQAMRLWAISSACAWSFGTDAYQGCLWLNGALPVVPSWTPYSLGLESPNDLILSALGPDGKVLLQTNNRTTLASLDSGAFNLSVPAFAPTYIFSGANCGSVTTSIGCFAFNGSTAYLTAHGANNDTPGAWNFRSGIPNGATFDSWKSDNAGNWTAYGNISAGRGTTLVYVCDTDGTILKAGDITTVAAHCGTSHDSGLRLK